MNELLKKVIVIRDIISDSERDLSNISPYYPVDLLLGIMKDLMSLRTDNEYFDDFVINNPVARINNVIKESIEGKPDNYDFDEEHFKEHIYNKLKSESIKAYELFTHGIKRFSPNRQG